MAPDQFTYDPRNPVPTRGGAVCCDPKIFPWGPMDQRPVEKRKDVLVYTSAPLKQDLEVTGPIRVVLYASTSAADTDFTAKLVDVFPNGEARNLTDGILRIRYRQGLDKPELAKPGEIYPLTIDAGVTSNVFLAGHSIRVEISSSNFPRFDRNPNTGPRVRRRDGAQESAADDLSFAAISVAHFAAGDSGRGERSPATRFGIDFGERRAVWCEEKFRGRSQAPPDSGAVAKW